MPFHVGPVQPVKKVALSSNSVRLQQAEEQSICGLVGPQAWAGGAPPGGNIGHLLAIHTPVTARWRQGQAYARQLARDG